MSHVPGVVRVLANLKAEFNLIKEANGYWSTFNTVDEPDYPPDAIDRVYAEKDPAILRWIDLSPPGSQSTSYLNPQIHIFVVTTAKRDRGLQAMMLAQMVDLRRVMTLNPHRVHPQDATAAQAARGTRQIRPFDFRYRMSETACMGSVLSWWAIEYNEPRG